MNHGKRHSALFLIFLLAACSGSRLTARAPVARKGVLDLRGHDLARLDSVPLKGEWRFYPDQFLSASSGGLPVERQFLKVPGNWNNRARPDSRGGGSGFGTYELHVLTDGIDHPALYLRDVSTSHRIYIQGQLVASSGIAGKTAGESRPSFQPVFATFQKPGATPDPGAETDLTIRIEIANFSHNKGGLWEIPLLGDAKRMGDQITKRMLEDMFLFGAILIMGVYHLGLFSLRKKDRASLFFALFCFDISIRVLTTRSRTLYMIAPGIPWEIYNFLEYFSGYTAPYLFFRFLQSIFPDEFGWKMHRVILGVTTLFVASLILPSLYYTQGMHYYELFIIAILVYAVVELIRAVLHGRDHSLLSLSGFAALALTVLNDILYIENLIDTGDMMAIGLLVFLFAQASIMSRAFARAYSEKESLGLELSRKNEALRRFIPTEFLNLLGKGRIEDVKRGDQIAKHMTVFFSDIRSFTELSNTMSPDETFAFINYYLEQVGPVIRKHGGFIDKYLGDGVMALFPAPLEAIRAAIDSDEVISRFNEERVRAGLPPIIRGTGIHAGDLILGIVGENERVDGSVISSSVNMAARLESLAGELKRSILVTGSTFALIPAELRPPHRRLGTHRLKGFSTPIDVVEILSPIASGRSGR